MMKSNRICGYGERTCTERRQKLTAPAASRRAAPPRWPPRPPASSGAPPVKGARSQGGTSNGGEGIR
eukprot:4623060-Pleurochrysis_carterae.AAC.1